MTNGLDFSKIHPVGVPMRPAAAAGGVTQTHCSGGSVGKLVAQRPPPPVLTASESRGGSRAGLKWGPEPLSERGSTVTLKQETNAHAHA